MKHPFNSDWGNVAEVEEHVCDHSYTEQHSRRCKEEDRVEICLLRGFRGRNSHRLRYDILGESVCIRPRNRLTYHHCLESRCIDRQNFVFWYNQLQKYLWDGGRSRNEVAMTSFASTLNIFNRMYQARACQLRQVPRTSESVTTGRSSLGLE